MVCCKLLMNDMMVRGKDIKVSSAIALVLYYTLFRYFPSSTNALLGKVSKKMRYLCCKKIFKHCGRNVNIERGAFFGWGTNIEIGDNSGIGINCFLPANTKIGDNVLMGPNVYILYRNHSFSSTKIPIINQGYSDAKQVLIEDDVWIGRDVLMTPGRIVRKGSIIAAGTILCKNFPEYSIVGGNPSKLIRIRTDEV